MLFGHQNNNSDQAAPDAAQTSTGGVNPLAVDPATGASLPVAPPPPPADSASSSDPSSALDQPVPATIEAPAATVPDFSDSSSTNSDDTTSSVATPPEPVSVDPIVPADPSPSTDSSENTATTSAPTDVPADDLLTLKQEALSQLSPLVGQLDQTPEEKFRTTMMLIQSTDDPSRIPEAYKAAQAITDEKVRAQALLDVVNEINYFTQAKHTE
jgi:hypothetical protein